MSLFLKVFRGGGGLFLFFVLGGLDSSFGQLSRFLQEVRSVYSSILI